MSYYDYQPPNKFGYKDQLPEGDAEKVIKGSEFDDEFNKISAESQAIDLVVQEQGEKLDAEIADRIAGDELLQQQIDTIVSGNITIDIGDIDGLPDYVNENYVSKTIAEAQQIISTEFTFAFDGGVPLTIKNAGMYVNADYIRHNATEWEVSPSLNVLGNITAGGDLTVDGSTQLNSNLNVDGTIDATGNISTEANLNVTGDITGGGSLDITGDITGSGSLEISGNITGGGDITLNGGNIIIDGGSIVDPDGNPQGGGGAVDSVNSQTGVVVLTASDVGALPDSTVIPPPTDLTGYATETWVTNQNFATQTWVNNKGYSTYTGADAVKVSGNQSIGGAKTFTSNVTAPDFVATSDERAKEQISPMPVGLIDHIKPVQWTWKESGEKSAGVIAQQLQEIGLDDFVKEDENGMLGVNYNALISILIAEVISLKKERQ